ncbi:MAG TPA: sigma-54 dependent transcriptional regulator [Pirellulaceae bacterium]|nr:sigma-54 dependent transcriptional regulator [Pirellulaceae bacterium]HMO90665.1 sigma-54 dependent transcriptional regulator [Pirellulaceae bacterium]HMP67756.1 sigma-54 dependent transcriptional regulator [Pirellulaceae bacterium]
MKSESQSQRNKSIPLKVLFADDEAHLQELIRAELPRMGHQVTVCPDGLTAVAALEKNTFDCVIVDLDMPGMNGIGVIAKVKELSPSTETVVLTGKGTMESAVEALRYGSFDYLQKPCKLIEIQALLNRIGEKRELAKRCQALQIRLHRIEGESKLIGQHRSMQRVRALIEKVAPTESTVLILGETGTGKELAARAVHDQSLRADKPFVAINCGALPENLIESELFGHRKGAFTGADENRTGLFEVADGGTIFLDEIGELPKALQAKLLRVLESGEIRKVGDNSSFKVDVRVVCATHRNLMAMVEAGEFREDLMYRINTFEVHLPPLRDRSEDIPELAKHLLARFCPSLPPDQVLLSPAAVEALQSYVWPGNVRELANVLEHAAILCEEFPIKPQDLPRHFGTRSLVGQKLVASGGTLRDLEAQAIAAALDRHDGNKNAAAEELGVSLKTLYNKINQGALTKRAA